MEPLAPPPGLKKPTRKLDQAARDEIGRRTREAMADPAIRARISEATKAGMRRRADWFPGLCALEAAWRSAPPEARRRFLSEIFESVSNGE